MKEFLSENEEILKLVGNTNGNKVTIRYYLKITTLDLFKANFESQINNTYFFLLLGVISKDGLNHVPMQNTKHLLTMATKRYAIVKTAIQNNQPAIDKSFEQ